MISIIPARGGSKGLVGKNIKNLRGKPLIAYTIEEALEAEGISRVIVNTDDEKIADVARTYGAEVPYMRPAQLATDTAKSIDVYKHAFDWFKQNEGIDFTEFIVLQPTSPLRTSRHINEAINLFYEKNADSVISYCQEDHPIFWHKHLTTEGKFEEIFKDAYLKNRQEIRPTFYPNGAIYIFKKELILKNIYTNKNSYAYVMDKIHSVDIDTIDDFEFADYLLNK